MSLNSSYEALLNEYKGNLFEFLVGLELARGIGKEKKFLDSTLNTLGDILEQQESFVRNYYPDLLSSLALWSNELVKAFESEYPLSGLSEIALVGKASTGLKKNEFKEADLLLKYAGEFMPVSVKLARYGSFINTKSAGVKSFYSKYFPIANQDMELQLNFDKLYESDFEFMAMSMHEEAGLVYTENFKSWIENGFETLPGKLPPGYKTFLNDFYEKVNLRLYQNLSRASEKFPEEFRHSICLLAGFSNNEIVQLIGHHDKESKGLKAFTVKKILEEPLFKGLELKKNNVELNFDQFKIQLRLKPMNQFTSKSYKINCAIKHH